MVREYGGGATLSSVIPGLTRDPSCSRTRRCGVAAFVSHFAHAAEKWTQAQGRGDGWRSGDEVCR